MSIIRIYIYVETWISFLCSEETITIKTHKSLPETIHEENFTYVCIEKDIRQIIHSKILKISILQDEVHINRGIFFMLENEHNICYYNRGYDYDEEIVFFIDGDKKSIPYSFIDI